MFTNDELKDIICALSVQEDKFLRWATNVPHSGNEDLKAANTQLMREHIASAQAAANLRMKCIALLELDE
jgi:hypothetical protein